MHGISLGVLSAEGFHSFRWIDCGSGPVDCSDWTRVHSAVDFSPGGVRIGYIRGELWDRSSTDAVPVTGSLVFSALFGCLDILCCWIYCVSDIL